MTCSGIHTNFANILKNI